MHLRIFSISLYSGSAYNTHLKKLNQEIQRMTTGLLEEYQNVMFPLQEVHIYRVLKNCSNCSQRLNKMNSQSLFKCNNYNLKASAKNVKRTTQLVFISEKIVLP